MSGPAKPPKLEPGHSYVHVTSHFTPDAITNAISANPQYRLKYVGPVGELKGEHIFEVQDTGGPIERAEKPVLDSIRQVEGVKGVKVVELKQRAKREEF